MVTVIIALIVVLLSFGLSWLITCGIVYLITACFSLEFKWSIATGIWLILVVIKSIFNNNKTSR